MGDPVQLVNMKQYTMNRLSINGGSVLQPTNTNGATNGGTDKFHQNGFVAKTEYGDWDSNMSPVASPKDKVAPPIPSSPDRHPPRRATSSVKPLHKFIPEVEIDIPKDGSLFDYSVDDMSTFLRYMGVEERIVTHVHKKGLDGVKFSKLKDSDLEALSMKNPVICHFRDKSIREKGGKKKKLPFML